MRQDTRLMNNMQQESREYLCKKLDDTINFLYELMDNYEKTHGIDFFF